VTGSTPHPGTGAPRAEGYAIAVDIPTRAGLATVAFTSRDIASARPASGAFTYRDRRYSGSLLLTGPRWDATASAGLTLLPSRTAAGRGVATAIAGLVSAAVAAWLHEHPEVLDLAGHAHAAARRARARRDLELVSIEITAAEDHLARLRRKQDQLRVTAEGTDGEDAPRPSLPGPQVSSARGGRLKKEAQP
jgi:hypothetical protein